MTEVPALKKHILKALLTLFRSKKLDNGDYFNEAAYTLAGFNSKQISEYCAEFHIKDSLPLPYFYLICQGIHSAEMVDKKFPLPIPGMVHLESTIESKTDIDPELPIEIKSSVSISDKESGSFIPIFNDEFYQNGLKVLEAESVYLVKRKRKGQEKKKAESKEETEYDNWISSLWRIPGKMGFHYAKLSGDYNPIHLLNLFAWIFGFKKKIIQGWYLASRAVAEVENDTHMPAKSLHVIFSKPVYIPSSSIFEFRLSNERNLHFRLVDKNKKATYIKGKIS